MKKLAFVFAAALVAMSARADESALAWSHRYVLLTAQADSQLRPILEELKQDANQRDRDTRDLLAEILLHYKADKAPLQASGFSMAQIIAAGPQGARYYDVIARTRSFFGSASPGNYFTAYEQKYRTSRGEQYVPGTIDIDAMRRQFIADALAASPTAAQSQALADLPTGATIEQLFAAAGKPAFVASRDVRIDDLIATIEVRRLWFYYRGIGRVVYDYQREGGWAFHELVADAMAFESAMPYRTQGSPPGMPDDRTLAMIQLLSGNPSSIKASAQYSYRSGDPPLEYLDAAAEVLLTHYQEIANTGANDAYAWICNVLSDRGGQRYKQVLETVELETTDPKLRRYASQIIRRREGIPTTPYVAGSVSLAALAGQYPTLYPGSTLIRGLL